MTHWQSITKTSLTLFMSKNEQNVDLFSSLIVGSVAKTANSYEHQLHAKCSLMHKSDPHVSFMLPVFTPLRFDTLRSEQMCSGRKKKKRFHRLQRAKRGAEGTPFADKCSAVMLSVKACRSSSVTSCLFFPLFCSQFAFHSLHGRLFVS